MGEEKPAWAGGEAVPAQRDTQSVCERPVIAHTIQVNSGAVLDGPIATDDSNCSASDITPTDDSAA